MSYWRPTNKTTDRVTDRPTNRPNDRPTERPANQPTNIRAYREITIPIMRIAGLKICKFYEAALETTVVLFRVDLFCGSRRPRRPNKFPITWRWWCVTCCRCDRRNGHGMLWCCEVVREDRSVVEMIMHLKKMESNEIFKYVKAMSKKFSFRWFL